MTRTFTLLATLLGLLLAIPAVKADQWHFALGNGGNLVLVADRGRPGGDRDRDRDRERDRERDWDHGRPGPDFGRGRPPWHGGPYRPPYLRPGYPWGHPPVVIVPYPGHPPVIIGHPPVPVYPRPRCYDPPAGYFFYRGDRFGFGIVVR